MKSLSKADLAKAQAEMAQRVLARRRMVPFVQRFNSRYDAGWVHKDICRRLEKFSADVVAKKSPRLMLLVPPRHGKSELVSRNFPAWHLGQHPDHEFIACSYNVSLAMDFSRKVKQIIQDPLYENVFPTRLDPNNQSTESWGVQGERGGYVAAGIGGAITGKGAHILSIDDPCVAQGSRVRTQRGLIPIEFVQVGDVVWTHRGRWRPVVATYDNGVKPVVELSTSTYKIILTPEHLVYTSGGWVPATEAKDVYGEELSAVWSGVPGAQPDSEILQRSMPWGQSAHRPENLPSMRDGVPAEQGFGTGVLQCGVSSCGPYDARAGGVPELREGVLHTLEAEQVLQHRMPARTIKGSASPEAPELRAGRATQDTQTATSQTRSAGPGRTAVRRVRQALRAFAHLPAVLFARVQEFCAFQADERHYKLELPSRAGGRSLQSGVQESHQQAGAGNLRGVHAVWIEDTTPCAPSGRGQNQQLEGQPGVSVSVVPHEVSQVRESGVARVYDLTVEDDHSFVAEGLVVHNCKNAEEADSVDTREKIWEWYLSTAYSRLAPGGGVLVVMTHWHDDDLAGRLQLMMKEGHDDIHVDQFEVIKYPAIAEADEWFDASDGRIVYDAPPTSVPLLPAPIDLPDAPPRHVLLRSKGEALHPERYDLEKLYRIKAQNKGGRWWSALYQQNPVPDDGGYFTKDQFRRGAPPQVRNANVFIAWDFAISEKKQNDYTVGTVVLQDSDDILHVTDQVRFKSGDAFFIAEAILNLALKWYSPTLVLGFEDGQIWRAIEALIKKRMRERKFYPSIQVLRPLTDKLARARPLQGRMQQGMVSFSTTGEWYESLRSELLRFPAGAHDDQCDSLSWAVHLAVGREAPRKTEVKQMKSWRDKLKTYGSSESHMVA